MKWMYTAAALMACRPTVRVQPPPCGPRQRHRHWDWYRFHNAKKPRSCAPHGGRLQPGVGPQSQFRLSDAVLLFIVRVEEFGSDVFQSDTLPCPKLRPCA